MVCLTVAENLLAVFLTTVRAEFGGVTGLLRSNSAVLVALLLWAGSRNSGYRSPLADRLGGNCLTFSGVQVTAANGVLQRN
jgi:hypothetical protein